MSSMIKPGHTAATPLSDVLRKHQDWIDGEPGGVRANLNQAYIVDTYFTDATLIDAETSQTVMTPVNSASDISNGPS